MALITLFVNIDNPVEIKKTPSAEPGGFLSVGPMRFKA
jgi:hypothetical protein